MRQLLNTLFVTSEDVYLSLDGENVVANRGGEAVARYPLHTLQSIVTFSYSGASPALMGACAKREIGLTFCTQRGQFLARVSGQMQGNVLLRRTQYRVADDPSESCRVARMMILGKVYNARWSVDRTRRDHAMRIDSGRFTAVSQQLQGLLPQITAETSLDSLRGLEGAGATACVYLPDGVGGQVIVAPGLPNVAVYEYDGVPEKRYRLIAAQLLQCLLVGAEDGGVIVTEPELLSDILGVYQEEYVVDVGVAEQGLSLFGSEPLYGGGPGRFTVHRDPQSGSWRRLGVLLLRSVLHRAVRLLGAGDGSAQEQSPRQHGTEQFD